MTNFEKYKDEILKLTEHTCHFGLVNGRLLSCYEMNCSNCKFDVKNCVKTRFQWLYEEHNEPAPKLKPKERVFCEAFYEDYFYIARDDDGLLFLYECEPVKAADIWSAMGDCNIRLNESLFPFIDWTDEKPWSIADLLKLEVE